MKIAMGNDHSAVEMKEAMKAYVESKGYEAVSYTHLDVYKRQGQTTS